MPNLSDLVNSMRKSGASGRAMSITKLRTEYTEWMAADPENRAGTSFDEYKKLRGENIDSNPYKSSTGIRG